MALASGSISPQCNVIGHHLGAERTEVETNPIPPSLIQVELTIEFKIISQQDPMTHVLSSSQETLRFNLNAFHDHHLFDQLLALAFATLGINISLTSYNTILVEIMGFGLGIADTNRGCYCKALSLHSVIEATLVESEFESSSHGMVAATQSFVNDMLKRVRVEEEENCTICFEQLEVGFESSQMPCSHSFHADCIRKWLNLSHYCPICRYQMPGLR